ncbi:hypothetical protein [Virgibacillus alimentarius]|uniref:Phosphatidylinositol kinase n=1 Tax=Virgibacillus alimentarius TaxID=698769 RepID=A0ABS4SA17_9BACI|nr:MULTISPECIES: hypothetical protein [Virgibacillus]MBP2258249.1 hypothetical protein [Virgibacillus alimentarius]HLR65810.1 hypothetical protein [Virgibacillus sp.]
MHLKNDHGHKYEMCKKHMHSYVLVETSDGSTLDGIITGLDDEYVYLAIPIEHGHSSVPSQHYPMHRQFGYGYPGYGGYGHYGYRPRFRRLVLPLAALTALSILPWY